ncbi:MAG: aminotransferase class I/II-fold pyridoxal phosphate-dependent enzyme [Chloroflexota bacterium]|nr:MAG: aminotransferase class I/II-fold pyridoxal phosphate-dependent enzyme [Chloroflexota bacterium]
MPTTVKTPPEPRAAISRMHPYEWEPPSASIARQAGVPEDQVVRFDTNTFPWPGARLDALPPELLNEYPDTSYATLTEAIAQYVDVPTDRVTVGAGADEILDLIKFLEHARGARLTWLCNPNNPTGELLPLNYVEEVAVATDGVLVVDEAYFETSGVSALPLIERLPNVVVVRTLSKAFGLAGVRVGYALAGAAISDALRRVRPPGSISVVSAALGAQALSDIAGMRQRVQQVKAERTRLRRGLQALDLEVRDSAANFLLVQTGRHAAPALLKKGLVVRTFPATSLLAEYIRVTVRLPEENDRLRCLAPSRPVTSSIPG